ncbi:MAG: DUF3604 domain-containing protein [Myxococcales bacterium]|nr:DUF3604 domain-containing protein [Myxococcales bacterium]MCB9628981.1 DUF3604 domain-containing protein [Sandaracinaceae bacterium]
MPRPHPTLPRFAHVTLALLTLVACGRTASPTSIANAGLKARAPLVARTTETLGRCAHFDRERQVFFGDLHVHTELSLDANMQGTRMTPTDAYRFARGESVGIGPYDEADQPTRHAQLRRPLDFAAVTDHAEFLGVVGACSDRGGPAYDRRGCRAFRNRERSAFIMLHSFLTGSGSLVRDPFLCGWGAATCMQYQASVWVDLQDATEAAYDKSTDCRFTTLHAYEWSATPSVSIRVAANLHRNVIFRNNIVPALPADYVRASSIEQLWRRLERECLRTGEGCDVLAIPHNSNLSAGVMFAPWESGADRFSLEHARRRAYMEPLVEIFQHKGASECVRGGLTGDEDCGFELVPYGDLAAAGRDKPNAVREESFVRSALATGMSVHRELRVNPFSVGFIGSTDTHLGLPGAVEESAFLGGGGAGEGAEVRADQSTFPDNIYFGGGGLAAVWAEENSREGIFGALRRRETYATSGPRIALRVFAGWELGDAWCERPDRVAHAYETGVSMGGELGAQPVGGGAPTLAITALRDPQGAHLQRVQVIKGTLGVDGTPRVQVFDVYGDRGIGRDVNLSTCEPSSAGSDQICTTFRDPTFDPREHAYYYVRVLEVPTCRWTTHVCVREQYNCAGTRPIDRACCAPEVGLYPESCVGVRCGPDNATHRCCDNRTVEPVIQERAWSSPIWFYPAEATP